MNALKAGAAYFLSVFAVGFMLGTVRVFLLEPRFGAFGAVLIETPFILTASWLLCHHWVQRFRLPAQTSPRLLMGTSALALLLLAEFMLSRYGFNRAFSEQLGAYKTPAGALGLAGQIIFALFPLLQKPSAI